MNRRLWVILLIIAFTIGSVVSYEFFPRTGKSQDYNAYIRERIEVYKNNLLQKGFLINETKIPDSSYFGIKDFSLFKAFAEYENITIIGLEIELGTYIHARFWYYISKTPIIYEVI